MESLTISQETGHYLLAEARLRVASPLCNRLASRMSHECCDKVVCHHAAANQFDDSAGHQPDKRPYACFQCLTKRGGVGSVVPLVSMATYVQQFSRYCTGKRTCHYAPRTHYHSHKQPHRASPHAPFRAAETLCTPRGNEIVQHLYYHYHRSPYHKELPRKLHFVRELQ